MSARSLKLEDIRLDGDTNPRAELDRDVVHDYAEKYAAGVKMPPPLVFFDGEKNWLVDGFHRWHAARKAKVEKLLCTIVKGTLEAARWASYAQNQAHGQRRSNPDKQRAVIAALRHPKAASMTDVSIAEHVGVGHDMVADHRAKLAQDTSLRNPQTENKGKPRRVGKDNKSYPATKPRKKKPATTPEKPAPAPDPEPDSAEAPAVPDVNDSAPESAPAPTVSPLVEFLGKVEESCHVWLRNNSSVTAPTLAAGIENLADRIRNWN
jgi:hypothetical protein